MIRRLIVLGATMLAVAACGGSGGGTDTTTGGGAEGATITIADFAFSGPSSVAVGDTVTVVNNDDTAHTWSATDGTFNSGNLAPGTSFSFTFEEAGTFPYVCQIHPTMSGTIEVTG